MIIRQLDIQNYCSIKSLSLMLDETPAIIAEYKLFNINRTKLGRLIHRIFFDAPYNIEIADRFGKPVRPREWFLALLFVIDESVELIKDGMITGDGCYPPLAGLVRAQ